VAYLEISPRVGRSQGASIFWGLVSVFFAAAACFYFWKNHENEIAADKFRGEVVALQDECDELNSEKARLQASVSDTNDQLKAREDLVQQKETELAEEENRIAALELKNPPPTSTAPKQNPTAAISAMYKKFGDAAHKLVKDDTSEVILHGDRPILRLANSVLFAPGDATLKPEAKPVLDQIVQTVQAQADHFELRVECFTDSDLEMPQPGAAAAKTDTTTPHFATSWDLTAARAAAIARYFLVQSALPFKNVLVVARGDSEPIATGAKDNHARNRRVEISVVPVVDPLAPPPEPPPDKAK